MGQSFPEKIPLQSLDSSLADRRSGFFGIRDILKHQPF